MKYILAVLIVFLLGYLAFWFINLEFDFTKWTIWKRAFYIGICVIVSAVTIGILQDTKDNN